MSGNNVLATVRALYEFKGEESGDLSFREGEIIQVIKKDNSGWWRGIREDGRKGDFPYNYVEEIKKPDLNRPTSVFNEKGNLASRSETYEKLVAVKVSPVRGQAKYNVEANHARKSITAVKEMEDFRLLDDTLRKLYPNYDRPLPPRWADRVFESEETNTKKAKNLELYLQKILIAEGGTEQTEFSVVNWLNPSEKFRCSDETFKKVKEAESFANQKSNSRADLTKVARGTPIAKVVYQWERDDAVEISLKSGAFIAVRNQKTPNEGWWEGEDSCGQRGVFPSTYVQMLSPDEAIKACLGELKTKTAPQPMNFGAFNTPSPAKYPIQDLNEGSNKKSNRSRKTENHFKIPSLDAFDELLNDGFTMLDEGNELLARRADAIVPRHGDRVTLTYVAYVWDCQKQRIIEFASSDLPDTSSKVGPLIFTVGRGETIKALERAVQNLELGQQSRIIVRPELGYGEVGSPPNVPPNCHLIYDVTLDAFESGKSGGPAMSSAAYVSNRAKRPPQGYTYQDV